MKRYLAVIITVLFISTNAHAAGKQLVAVASIFPVYDFARTIGGNRTVVSLLVPPGTEIHSFEPKPSEIISLSSADFFMYLSSETEPWAGRLGERGNNGKINAVEIAANAFVIRAGAGNSPDPHVWLDFGNAKKMADNIAAAFSAKDPGSKHVYTANTEKLKKEFDALDKLYSDTLKNCREKKVFYLGHAAFGYMARRYNLQLVSAQGFKPDSEPSAKTITSIISQIRAAGTKTVFTEELLHPRFAATISGETGAKILELNPAGNVSKQEFSAGIRFSDIMKKNLEEISRGLQCTKQ